MRFLDANIRPLTASGIFRVLAMSALMTVVCALLLNVAGVLDLRHAALIPAVLAAVLLVEMGISPRTPRAMIVAVLLLATAFATFWWLLRSRH